MKKSIKQICRKAERDAARIIRETAYLRNELDRLHAKGPPGEIERIVVEVASRYNEKAWKLMARWSRRIVKLQKEAARLRVVEHEMQASAFLDGGSAQIGKCYTDLKNAFGIQPPKRKPLIPVAKGTEGG